MVGSTGPTEQTGGQRGALRIDMIDDAIAALERSLGGPQRYFEINATGQLVNLFVAAGDGSQAVAYVYRPGSGLEAPADPQPASGSTFAAADVAFEPTVLAQVLEDLPTSLPTLFAVSAAPGADGIAEYRAYFTSTAGGQVVAVLAPDGTVLSSDIG